MSFRIALAAACAVTILVAGQVNAQTRVSADDPRVGDYFQVGGDRIFYQIAGHGPAMLLIHGFPLSGALFQNQVSTLSVSYTVIAPDLPGFGKSTTGFPFQTEQHYAEDLFALLDSLSVRRAIIGGHSMGGQVTLEMYRQQPSRLSGMILFDTNPAPASVVEQAQWPAYGVQAEQLGSASIAPSVVGVMVTGTALAIFPDLGTKVTNIVSEASPNGVLAGGIALASRFDYRPLLGDIKVPTLVVEGLDDTVYPFPIAQTLQAAVPGSTLAIVPDAAHASMFQRPVYTNTAILNWAKASGLTSK